MEYRGTANELMETLGAWDKLIPGGKKVRLIACGGTALTLLGHKESTKDVDFIVPDKKEYERLVHFLQRAGYQQPGIYSWRRANEVISFDIYPGKSVYTTELLSSPLAKDGHKKIREWSKLYLGVLNPADLIISKMFRGSGADFDDSLVLLQKEKVDLKRLEKRYKETAKYDVSEARVLRNLEVLLNKVKKV
ncbi:MAG: hypothetical protein A3G87_01615 [Omnitrophica bacterium RIFCSPLOWO2_12_FULL_50_11]|nr:MAG: hypothetical protein A3G87_01615 [Omnitrophica bacterium RIFCSPLOWO2_12_FULL_50_11]